MNEIIATESSNFDLKEIVASLNNLLRWFSPGNLIIGGGWGQEEDTTSSR